MYHYDVSLSQVTPDGIYISYKIETASRTVESPILPTPSDYTFNWGDDDYNLWEDPLGDNIVTATVYDTNQVPLYLVQIHHQLDSVGEATCTFSPTNLEVLPLAFDRPASMYLNTAQIFNYPVGLVGEVVVDAFSDLPTTTFPNTRHLHASGTFNFISQWEGAGGAVWPVGDYTLSVRTTNPHGGPVTINTWPIKVFDGLFIYQNQDSAGHSTFSGYDPSDLSWNVEVSFNFVSQPVDYSISLISGPSPISGFSFTPTGTITGENYTTPIEVPVAINWLVEPGTYVFRATITSGAAISHADFVKVIQKSGFTVYNNNVIDLDSNSFNPQAAWDTITPVSYPGMNMHGFPIELTAGQVITITVLSKIANYPPAIVLTKGTDLLAANSNPSPTEDTIVFTVLTTGLHVIGVGFYNNLQGSFYLAIGVNQESPVIPDPPVNVPRAILTGQTLSGDNSVGPYTNPAQIMDPFNLGNIWQIAEVFTFEGLETEVVTIRYITPNGKFTLVDPTGTTLEDIITTELSNYALPTTGTYKILASYTTGSGGAFTLGLNPPASQTILSTVGVLNSTSEAGFNTNKTPVVRYTFEGVIGDNITITMLSDNGWDTYLYLLDNTNTILTEDDDSAGNLSSLINWVLPYTGTYHIECCAFSYDIGNKNFTITIVRN